MFKKKEENPKITRVSYTDFVYRLKNLYKVEGTLCKKYYITTSDASFKIFSQEIDDLISLLQTVKEYESQELMKESCK